MGIYQDLSREMKKLWKMKLIVIPIVVRALGTVFKKLEKRVNKLEIRGGIENI